MHRARISLCNLLQFFTLYNMKKFNYLRVVDPSDEDLLSYGQSGYELAAVASDYSGHTYIFKQCLDEETPKVTSAKEPVLPTVDSIIQEAIKEYGKENKLGQVRYVKEALRLGLKEAKDIVDDYWEEYSIHNSYFY